MNWTDAKEIRDVEVCISNYVWSVVQLEDGLPPDENNPSRPPRGCVVHRAHLPVPVRGGCAELAEVTVLVPPAQGGDSMANWNLGCRSGCELRTSLGTTSVIGHYKNQTRLTTSNIIRDRFGDVNKMSVESHP